MAQSVVDGRVAVKALDNAANPRQLAAMPSSKDKLASQIEEMPRSNTANAERESVLLFSKTAKIASKYSLLPENAASRR